MLAVRIAAREKLIRLSAIMGSPQVIVRLTGHIGQGLTQTKHRENTRLKRKEGTKMALIEVTHSKDFYCENCLVEFRIIIEPRTTIRREKFDEEYPRSVKWLEEVVDCPVCGRTVVDQD